MATAHVNWRLTGVVGADFDAGMTMVADCATKPGPFEAHRIEMILFPQSPWCMDDDRRVFDIENRYHAAVTTVTARLRNMAKARAKSDGTSLSRCCW